MNCPLSDTFFSLFFSCVYFALGIFFPLKSLLKWALYNPTHDYFNNPKRVLNFQRDISELQRWPVKQLKARAGFMIFSCCFYLMFMIAILIGLSQIPQKDMIAALCFIPLFFSLICFFFWFCWKMAFYPLYALVNKKSDDIEINQPLSLSNKTLDWFFCSRYQVMEIFFWIAGILIFISYIAT